MKEMTSSPQPKCCKNCSYAHNGQEAGQEWPPCACHHRKFIATQVRDGPVDVKFYSLEEIDMRSGYTAGKQIGRKEVLEELLREMPKKQTQINPDTQMKYYKPFNKGSVEGYNEAVATIKSLIEKKLNEHD